MMVMLHVIFCLSPGIWQWLISTTLGSNQIYCLIGVEKSYCPVALYVCSRNESLGKQRILWITAAHSPDWLETINWHFWVFLLSVQLGTIQRLQFPGRSSVQFPLCHFHSLLRVYQPSQALAIFPKKKGLPWDVIFSRDRKTLEWKLLHKGSLQKMIKLPYLGETLEKR